MTKRGQVSIWIILGILIIIILAVGFLFRDNILDFLREKQLIGVAAVPKEVESVNNFILDCVHKTGEEALSFTGSYAGFYNTLSVNKNSRGIPYYFVNGSLFVPTKKLVEQSLAAYVNNNLKYCTNNFEDFNNSFSFKEENVSSKVTINPGKVNFYVKYVIKLKKGATEYELKFFNVDIDNNLDKIYNAAAAVVNEQRNYTDICLSCLYEVGVAKNLTIEIYNPAFGEVEYSFVDEQFKILDNQSYKFVIALRLSQ